MDDFFKSIKAYLYDRSVSPLMGSIVISWCLWNYKVIMTIFSSEALKNKFVIVDALYQESMVDLKFVQIPGCVIDGIIIPLTVAAFYIFIYPYIAKPVYEFSLKRRKSLRDVKNRIEDLQLLTLEESRRIYREMSKMERRHESEVAQYRDTISVLKKDLNDALSSKKMRDENNADDSPKFNEIDKLDVIEEKILQLFSGLKDGHGWTAASIKENMDAHIDKIRYYLESLNKRNFITLNGTTEDEEMFYQLRPEGRTYLVDNDLLLEYEKLSNEVKEKLDETSEIEPKT